MARPDSTRQYWLFLIEPRGNLLYWFLQPQHLWILGLVGLLCYAFSYHLTSPVRKLQKTVVRFGEGDFSARSDMHRRDELGKLSRSFNEMADRIQTLLKAERRLLQDISHEGPRRDAGPDSAGGGSSERAGRRVAASDTGRRRPHATEA
jgi:two-component system sensor histidine kinase CpxA